MATEIAPLRRRRTPEQILADRREGRARAKVLAQKLAATEAGAARRPKKETVMSEPDRPIFLCTSHLRGPMQVVVVGCGGTGARVVAPLSQMLRPGDALVLLDHDIVEDRNLLRQHFTARDIGSPKSLVLGSRYRREGIHTMAFQQRLTVDNMQQVGAQVYGAVYEQQCRPVGTILIGCVDNAAARRGMHAALQQSSRWGLNPMAWIDAGNEMRAGQVLLSLKSWNVKVVGPTGPGYEVALPVNMDGLATAMPQLLRDAPDEVGTGCAERMDLQSVQVNHMAAAGIINTVSWLLLGIPFTSCGAFFSTLNTMQPIRIAGVRSNILLPETTHAISV